MCVRTIKGFIPLDVPHVFGDRSNDWLVVSAVPMLIGLGWLLKPKAALNGLLPFAAAVGNALAAPRAAEGTVEGDEPKFAHGRTG